MKPSLEVTVTVELYWREFEAVVSGPLYAVKYFREIEGALEETVFYAAP